MLVGRESERGTISTLLAGARMGHGRVLVLIGEPGIGKTALLREAESSAAGMRVLRAQGTESERMLPFGGLLQVLRPLLHHLDDLPAAQQAALSAALLLGAPADEPDRFAIGAATLGLLARAADELPLALLLDDVHLLDAPSSEALAFAARRLGADPVAVLATSRPDEPSAAAWTTLPTMMINGLDLDAAAALISSDHDQVRHDQARHDHVRRDQLLRLFRATAGNPLALLELRQQGHRLDAIPDGFPLPLSTKISEAFTGRLAGLSAGVRTALLVAAVESSSTAVVYAACRRLGLPGPLLGEAEDAGLLTVQDDRLVFRHPLVRSAVYTAAAPELRRRVHRTVAAVLPGGDLHRTAWHLSAGTAGPDESVAALLDRVAADAASRGAYTIAADAAERAAQLSASPPTALRRIVSAAESAWAGGQTDRTTGLLNRAASYRPTGRDLAHIQELRGAVETRCGSLDRALATLLGAADTIRADDPDAAVRLLADAIHVSFYLAAPRSARLAADQITALAPRLTDPDTRALGSLATGMALVINGDGDSGTRLIREAASDLIGPGELRTERFRLPLRVQSALWLRESGPTRQLIDAAIEQLRAEGALGSLPYLLMHIGRNAATTEDWDEAQSAYQEAIRLARETGQTTELAASLAGLAWLSARRGDEPACREAVETAEPVAAEHHVGLASFWLLWARGDLAAGLGRVDEAVRHYRELQERMTEVGFADPDQWCTPELVECELQLGHDAEARRAAGQYMINADRKGRPWAKARAERAAGLVATVTEAEQHFSMALALHRLTPDRYETARTELAYGSWLRRVRRRVDARQPLRSAVRTFDRLGARPWADRAARELAATGGSVARRQIDGVAALTPQEFQIARLLADGRTTREAAAALFLSPKTIEYHLRHVYLKLGIASRDELTARLAR